MTGIRVTGHIFWGKYVFFLICACVPVLLADWERWGRFLSLWGSRMSRYLDTMRTEMK